MLLKSIHTFLSNDINIRMLRNLSPIHLLEDIPFSLGMQDVMTPGLSLQGIFSRNIDTDLLLSRCISKIEKDIDVLSPGNKNGKGINVNMTLENYREQYCSRDSNEQTKTSFLLACKDYKRIYPNTHKEFTIQKMIGSQLRIEYYTECSK